MLKIKVVFYSPFSINHSFLVPQSWMDPLGLCPTINHTILNPMAHYSIKSICGKAHNLSPWVSQHVICTSFRMINLGTYVHSLNCWPMAHKPWNLVTPWKRTNNSMNTMIRNITPNKHKWKCINHGMIW